MRKFTVGSGQWTVVCLILVSRMCFAKDVTFEAYVDRNKVPLGRSIQLNLTFYGTQGMPNPDLPAIDGFESRYLGPSTRMSIVNGQVSSSVTHIYTLIPLKTGIFQIGPFLFEYKGDKWTSKPVSVEVVEGPVTDNTQPQEQGRELADLKDRIFLRMETTGNKSYLNEIIPLTIKLYVNKVAIKDIQYPEFNHEGFSAGEFDKPKQYQEVLDGIPYEVIEFNTSLFGTSPGEFRLGPAQVKYNLMVRKEKRKGAPSGFEDFFGDDVFDNFFGRYETYPMTLKSADIPVTILSLPKENKPQNFTGAIGNFTFDISAEPKEVKVGDPVTLKMAIKGEGNFNTVHCPKLSAEEGFKIYEPQVKQESGVKAFEQVLMPMKETIKEIPGIGFSFFSPQKETYQTIVKGPFPIKVTKPEKEEETRIVEVPQTTIPARKEMFGKDIIYIKDSSGRLKRKGVYLYNNRTFLSLQILPLLIVIVLSVINKRNERLKTDIRYARQLSAPRKAKQGIKKTRHFLYQEKIQDFYDSVFKTLQEYLGDKFHLTSRGITAGIIDNTLKSKGISEETLDKLKDIFKDCDMARYAPSQFGKKEMEVTCVKLEEVIDYLQRHKV